MLKENLKVSLTPYHTVENVKKILGAKAVLLQEGDKWTIEKSKTYYVVKDGSAVIVIKSGGAPKGFNIIAAHTDSPCLKLKHNPEVKVGRYVKFNVEKYGGAIHYSWLDIPLYVAGRIIYRTNDGRIYAKTYKSDYTVIIPSLAVHLNREINNSFSLNPQQHLQPLVSINKEFTLKLPEIEGSVAVDYDLYLVSAIEPFICGAEGEFLVSPRIDDLACVYAGLDSLTASNPQNIAVAYFANNEEVGSSTKQGAGSRFLADTLQKVASSVGENYDTLLRDSIMLSADNAHALHPNYPEKSDPTNLVELGGGLVVKYHANQHYTTDAVSASIVKTVAQKANVPTQDFFSRADVACGGTLGAISSMQVPVLCADVGIPQLAMHSATETMALCDYSSAVKLLTAFLNAKLTAVSYDDYKIE